MFDGGGEGGREAREANSRARKIEICRRGTLYRDLEELVSKEDRTRSSEAQDGRPSHPTAQPSSVPSSLPLELIIQAQRCFYYSVYELAHPEGPRDQIPALPDCSKVAFLREATSRRRRGGELDDSPADTILPPELEI